MNKKPMKELVKRKDWQSVREKLVGQWSTKPEWCCSQLRNWLGSVNSASEDKLRIMMNYLTGTGFRTGKIKHPCVTKIRASVSSEMKKRKFQD